MHLYANPGAFAELAGYRGPLTETVSRTLIVHGSILTGCSCKLFSPNATGSYRGQLQSMDIHGIRYAGLDWRMRDM